MENIFRFIKKRKIISAVILIAVIFFGYYGIKRFASGTDATRYVLAAVEKGTLVLSVTGSGQVSALNQVDIKPNASGDVISLAVKSGSEVKKGDLIMELDSAEAQRAVRNAEIDLENAQISLSQTETAQQNSQDDLKKAYDQAFSGVSDAFSDFPSVLSGLKDALFGNAIISNQWNLDVYLNILNQKAGNYENTPSYNSYHLAKTAYDSSVPIYNQTSRLNTNEKIDALIDNAYQTAKTISIALKNAENIIQSYKNELRLQDKTINPAVDAYLSGLNSSSDKINGYISSIFSSKQTIRTKAGADPLTVKSKQLALSQKENALSDAREKFADYYIRAPFDGVVAKMDAEAGDSVSNSASVATIATKQMTASIALNEVDAAKVKTGQKVTATFDAIDGLSISGVVAEIDSIGAVSQGVVSYNTKIIFDTQDSRIKSGMTVSTSIITDIKTDVLLIPNSAIKNQNGGAYVEELDKSIAENLLAGASGITSKTLPKQLQIETGLSNDSMTEIVSGLNEGDQIISRTIASGAASAQKATTQSIFPTGGGTRSTTNRPAGGAQIHD